MAEDKFREFLSKQLNPSYVRFGVSGGGCSGFEWKLAIVEHFDPEWNRYDFNDVTIFVDMMSEMYLDGTEIDYVENPLGQSGFTFHSDAVKSTCGCGQSFTV